MAEGEIAGLSVDKVQEPQRATTEDLNIAVQEKRTTYSGLMDAIESDLEYEGPYMFKFGNHSERSDERVVLLPGFKDGPNNCKLVNVVTWDGPKSISLSDKEHEKLQNLEIAQANKHEEAKGGGYYGDSIAFNNSSRPNESVSVGKDQISDLDPDEFMQAAKEAQDKSPFRGELDKQNKKLKTAIEIQQIFRDSIISPGTQTPDHIEQENQQEEQTEQTPIPKQIDTTVLKIRKTYLSLIKEMLAENNETSNGHYSFKFGSREDNPVIVFSNNEDVSENGSSIMILTPDGPKSVDLSKEECEKLKNLENKQNWGHPHPDRGGVLGENIVLGENNESLSIPLASTREAEITEFMQAVNKVRPEIPNQRQKLMTPVEREQFKKEQEEQRRIQEIKNQENNFIEAEKAKKATEKAKSMFGLFNRTKPGPTPPTPQQ